LTAEQANIMAGAIDKVDASFIDRKIVGAGVGSVGKAFIWTNAVALSQSVGACGPNVQQWLRHAFASACEHGGMGCLLLLSGSCQSLPVLLSRRGAWVVHA
jgi:hypothetical protein